MYRHSISVGHLENAVQLLRIVSSSPGISLHQLIATAKADEILIRESHQKLIDLVFDCKWLHLEKDDQVMVSTLIPTTILGSSLVAQRELLWLYVVHWNPNWARHLGHGVKAARNNIPSMDVRQVFEDLGLFAKPVESTPEVVEWWARVANLSRSLEAQRDSLTGTEGEELSLDYEFRRTDVRPAHMALDSDRHGYDIRSRVNLDDSSPLFIEVKASRSRFLTAVLHLSRNEHDTCFEKGDSYIFHLWDLSGTPAKLNIVQGIEVIQHAPKDLGSGRWESVAIGFNQFDWSDAQEFEIRGDEEE